MRFLLLFLFLIPTAQAQWSTADKTRQTAYTVLHIADWGQTRYISQSEWFREAYNPILGSHPSTSKVDNYFFWTLMIHYGVAHALPSEYRRAFQYLTIGVQGIIVTQNNAVGIRFSF